MRGLALVALIAVVVSAGVLVARNLPEPAAAPEPIPTGEAVVVVTDLVQTETVAGRLRYRDTRAVRSGFAGTVTRLPDEGAPLSTGDMAFEIDGVAVLVLDGERPAWRPLVEGIDDGADVRQLEENLVMLGHLEGEADDEFDEATADAIEAWRTEADLPSGRGLEFGRVVFLPGEVRVAGILAERGQPVAPGQPVITISDTRQEVAIELDPDRIDLVAVGDPVVIVLPDDREIDGAVREVASTVRASAPEPGAPDVVDVVVALDVPTGLDLAPVDVRIERDRAVDVMAVPVRALLAISDGGYALERITPDGTELVGVEVGDFASGLVEIRGPIEEGDRVVIPR